MIRRALLAPLDGMGVLERVVERPVGLIDARTADWPQQRTVEIAPDVSGRTHYVETWSDTAPMAVVPRPALASPPALVAGVAVDWTLPAGATVAVDPLNGAAPVVETVDGVFSLSLPAGAWRIGVNPPFPFRAAEWHIEVSA